MHPPLAFGLTSLLAFVCGTALFQEPQAPGKPLATAAQQFLDCLTPAQRTAATAPLDDASREVWGFVPAQYPGVKFGDLEPAQVQRGLDVLRAVLSVRGIGKVQSIMALESVLHDLEQANGQDASHRDPTRYWLQVFGTPATTGAWAFRLQGHHVSLHFAIANGALVGASPRFLGSNPYEVKSGPHRGERILGREEDLARGLLALLTDEQLATAVIAVDAPPDIVLGPARKAADAGAAQGLTYAAMDALQRQVLLRLIDEYVDQEKGDLADAERAHIRQHGLDGIAFAWAGGLGRSQGHYYRIQGPTFVIEFDNTQNDANHVHTVYRDLEHDFGGDALKAHYQHDHAPGKEHGK